MMSATTSSTTCSACTSPITGKGMRCSRCKQARYCNRDCQRVAWKQHKRTCVAVATTSASTSASAATAASTSATDGRGGERKVASDPNGAFTGSFKLASRAAGKSAAAATGSASPFSQWMTEHAFAAVPFPGLTSRDQASRNTPPSFWRRRRLRVRVGTLGVGTGKGVTGKGVTGKAGLGSTWAYGALVRLTEWSKGAYDDVKWKVTVLYVSYMLVVATGKTYRAMMHTRNTNFELTL